MKFGLLTVLAVSAIAAVQADGIHEIIMKQKRQVVFNSRRLSGECLPVCVEASTEEPQTQATEEPQETQSQIVITESPTKNPTTSPTENPTASPTKNPTSSPTMSPVEPESQVEICPSGTPAVAVCEVDTDCLIHPNIDILNCPSCVAGQCVSKPSVNGNLNCCKRTPGNDLVITNGCGANNVCFGFNDHDQCEVNQHAAYCHPSCPEGNIGPNLDLAPKFSRCPQPFGNDQGSKAVTKIYPMDYCVNAEIKWKDRGNPVLDPPFDSSSDFSASTTPVVKDVSGLGTVCDPAPEGECEYDIDCIDHPNHDVMFCPTCVQVGDRKMCMDGRETKKMPNGNVNCCKRTPGNDLVITNGCGANNICWGFNINDQCEVNQHAAYCTPYCPLGNIRDDGTVDQNACPSDVDNDQGSAGLPKIYPMSYCACRDVKWKNNGNFDEIMASCGGDGMVYVEPTVDEPAANQDPVPTSFCSSGKLSIECGSKNVMTCGLGGSSNICSKQSVGGGGSLIAIDNEPAFTADYSSLCEEIVGMLQADFDNQGFGVSGEAIKCNEYSQGKNVKSEMVANFACYDDAAGDKYWDWVEGETLAGFETC